MNDIERLLGKTARSAEVHPSAELVESDVLRGRTALARTRRKRAMLSSVGGTIAASALVAAALLATGTGDPARVTTPGSDTIAASEGTDGVRLVSYSGEQLEGFIVDRVPAGWFLQGSNPYSLTIAPNGDDTHPDAFEGKLVVMLFSKDQPQMLPKDGAPVKVGENDGVVARNRGGDGASLYYQDDSGNFVIVQSPGVLGWTNRQLADFAEGVQVTINARQGRG